MKYTRCWQLFFLFQIKILTPTILNRIILIQNIISKLQ